MISPLLSIPAEAECSGSSRRSTGGDKTCSLSIQIPNSSFMKIAQFPVWNSPLYGPVESLYLQLPISALPEAKGIDDLECIQMNLKKSRQIVADLRGLMEEHVFDSEVEEITFFKKIKPLFSGSLIYWEQLWHLCLHCPIGGEDNLRKYYKKQLKNLKTFYELHIGFYEYLRGSYEYLDKLYFLRAGRNLEEFANSLDLNPKFTTLKDRLIGEIYANEQLENYIRRLLSLLLKETGSQGHSNLRWTGSRAGLVELIYALQSGGVYNNGQVGIKELADHFQHLFKVDLGNYYHVFNELRLRKKNRTALLDHLRERVIWKMDALDEK